MDNAKRNRSADNSAIKPPKRKRSSNRFFAEVAKGKVSFRIVYRSESDGKIPRSKWQWVEVALCNAFLDLLKEIPGPLPECTYAGWFQKAVKLIACDDDMLAELYNASRPRVRAWIHNICSTRQQR